MTFSDLKKYTQSLTLLYVEDEKITQEEFVEVFNMLFNKVIVASDGLEGLEKFEKDKIDIVITDINMPKMNGLSMIEEIKKINQDIKIIVLSAHNESKYFIECIKLSISSFLLKPLDTQQFRSTLFKIVKEINIEKDLDKNIHFLKQYKNFIDNTNIVSKADLDGNITYVNDLFCEVSGYTREELIGQNHRILKDNNESTKTYEELWKTIAKDKKIWTKTLKNKSKNGEYYYVKITIQPILDSDDNIVEYISMRNNITSVMTDKELLEDRVRSFEKPMVVAIQIDDYNDIVKYYGNDLAKKIEDKFLHTIYDFLPKSCEFTKVYMLEDGKYAFIKDNKDCTIGIDNVVLNLKEFQKNIENNILELDDYKYDVSILLSYSYSENALKNAFYGITKLLQTNTIFIGANNILEKEYEDSKKHLTTVTLVKEAIENHKIISYFQPIIDNKTQKIVKYESLVRLVDKDNNVLTPYHFLDVAKKARYYSQITSIVLENSFKALKYTKHEISINLSAIDIEKSSTREYIFRLLQEFKDDAHRVVFELLEDEDVQNFETIKIFINDIKSYGVQIAIDDFGAGYSNLSRVLDYQPNILKIDASLIKNIVTDEFSLNVVKTIYSFAKRQNIKVVAEYVENESIYKIITEIGVEYSQGYYFGKPASLD